MTTLFKIIDYFILFIHPSSNHLLWCLLYKVHLYRCFVLLLRRTHSRKHGPDVKLVVQWEAWRLVCWWVGSWVRGGGFSEGVLPGRQCGITEHVRTLQTCVFERISVCLLPLCVGEGTGTQMIAHMVAVVIATVSSYSTVNSVVPHSFTLLSFSVVPFSSIFFGWLFSHFPAYFCSSLTISALCF